MNTDKKSFIQRVGGFLKKPSVYIPLIVVVVLAGMYFRAHSRPAAQNTASVVSGTVVQEITVTGTVVPVQSVDLSFERSGRIVSVPVKVGDKVTVGDIVARLDPTSDSLSLEQASAVLEADQATLQDLQNGTRATDLAVLQSKVTSAKAALSDAKTSLLNNIQTSYTGADDAVRNQADQFFSNARSSNSQISINVTDSQLKIKLNQERQGIEPMLVSWKSKVDALTSNDDLIAAAATAADDLNVVKNFLDDLSLAVNGLETEQTVSATTLSTYRSSVSAARTEINAAISSVSAGVESDNGASAALDLANKNLAASVAGTVEEKIAAQAAKVDGDKAQIDSIKHNISLTVLRTPFAGTITREDAKVGQVAVANMTLVSVISASNLEIEAYVPEADIGKLTVGNDTTVTLDAFPGKTFKGTLSYIDPAETVLEGVPTYKIKLAMAVNDPTVKSGMTANLSIVTAEHTNVLTIPYRAVQGTATSRYVIRLLANNKTEKVSVTTGIRDTLGNVEVMSGLNLGDTVVIPASQ